MAHHLPEANDKIIAAGIELRPEHLNVSDTDLPKAFQHLSNEDMLNYPLAQHRA